MIWVFLKMNVSIILMETSRPELSIYTVIDETIKKQKNKKKTQLRSFPYSENKTRV